MKKTILTIAIVLGITLGASAQNRGLFDRGPQRESYDYYGNYDNRDGLLGFSLPSNHGETNDQEAPLGGGALLLIGFGAAYALKRRKKKEVRSKK